MNWRLCESLNLNFHSVHIILLAEFGNYMGFTVFMRKSRINPDGSSLGDIRVTDASILNASIHQSTNQSDHLGDNP